MSAAATTMHSPDLRNVAPVCGSSLYDFVAASGLHSVVVGTSKDPNAKITLLLVSPETRRPVLAVKAPTTDAAARAVEEERRLLVHLHEHRAAGLLDAIPRVVDSVEFDGRPALVMTAVPGTPMTTSYRRRRHTASYGSVAADFAAAESWLADFQRATSGKAAAMDMDGGVASRLRARFPDDEPLNVDLESLRGICDRLGENVAVRTGVHGDLWFGNMLLSGGGVSGVVDWELGASEGEPARDLVRFALMYALYLDWRIRPNRRVPGHAGLRACSWGAGVEFALEGNGWFPDLFRSFLQRGLARLGASPASWRDAALAGIAEVAARTDDHEFGRRHLQLFRNLASREKGRTTPQSALAEAGGTQ
jgi:aminoglycoside phosphotransferase (APT) family kinase protein